jgi:hypothetical protein
MRLSLGGVGEAFADRNFRIYSIGSILSWLSFYVQMVAISWTAWELTHSTTWPAIVAVLDIVPNLIFLPLGGVLADRVDRFRMVLAACRRLASCAHPDHPRLCRRADDHAAGGARLRAWPHP